MSAPAAASSPDITLPVAGDAEREFARSHARLYAPLKRYAWAELASESRAAEAAESTLAAVWQRHLQSPVNPYVQTDSLAFRMLHLRMGQRQRAAHDASVVTRLSGWAARASFWKRRGLRPATLQAVVDEALAAMRPRVREVFLLRREAELSYAGIAGFTGAGMRVISALMYRAQSVLRDHVDRAGFTAATRQSAADTGKWRIAAFSQAPDLYESQEAIIERDGNPDLALLSDYMVGELSAERRSGVMTRLESDADFRELAEPLFMAWSVPARSEPVSGAEVIAAWHRVRDRAGLSDLNQTKGGIVLSN